MRVLLYETSADGHRLAYVASLLPDLLSLIPDITVALPKCDLASPEYESWLRPFADRVTIDAFDTGKVQFRPATGGDRAKYLLQSIAKARAEHVYVPSADGLAQSITHHLPSRLARGFESEAGLHRGAFAYATHGLAAWKQSASLALLAASPWNLLHFVDVIPYLWIRARGGRLAARSRMLPDPVRRLAEHRKVDARKALGIPEDGRYVASTGLMTARKGIALLLHAMDTAPLRSDDRLLLTGRFDPAMRALIDGPYAHLVKSGRVIVVDRYLYEHELALTLSAADLVATPYIGHVGIASIVTRAASVGRPILANDTGWNGVIVPRVGLGWTCSATADGIAAKLPAALDDAMTYTPPPSAVRFLEFHDISNFRASLAARLRERLGHPPSPDLHTWDWVLTGDPNAGPQPLARGDDRVRI